MENHKWYLLIGQQCEVGKSKGYINGVYQTHEDGLLIDTNACESLVDPKEVTPLLRKVESMTDEDSGNFIATFKDVLFRRSEHYKTPYLYSLSSKEFSNILYDLTLPEITWLLNIGIWYDNEDFKKREIKEI